MTFSLPSTSCLLKLPNDDDDDENDDDDDDSDDNEDSGGSVSDSVNEGNNDNNSEEVQISDILCATKSGRTYRTWKGRYLDDIIDSFKQG